MLIQMTKKMIELLISGYEYYENERKSKDDGNTEVFYFKNATATFSSFTHESEVVKF